MIKNIKYNDKLYAILIKSDYHKDGVDFFTPDDFSQQLAFMSHKKGKIIDAHIHNAVKREVHFTKEVLVIRKGKLRVDFYDENQVYIESYVLEQGDIILLAEGGHGFEILEDCEMIEIKQGPYLGENDKTKFAGVENFEVKVID